MDRLSHITERFTAHFNQPPRRAVIVPLDEWALVQAWHPTNIRVSLGFLRAEPSDLSARFCPELVALQTEHLRDREFHAYLDAMQFAVDAETEMVGLDLEEATAAADLLLSERAPGSLRLMTEVQMAWLDRSAGSS